jgi:hypothetical protein
MFTLSNTANCILEVGLTDLAPGEFGYRFQDLVFPALRALPQLNGIYDNRGAGQPDGFDIAAGYGFEIKAWAKKTIELDSNSWKALPKFAHPRLVAMATDEPPYGMWVVKLDGLSEGSIRLSDQVDVDSMLEAHLKTYLSHLIEAVGVRRLVTGNRASLSHVIEAVSERIRGCA